MNKKNNNFIFGQKLANTEAYEPFTYEGQIRLDANESYLPLPEDIKTLILNEFSDVDFNRYPDPYAVKLCEAFSRYYDIDSKNVLAGNGSDELISLIMSGVLSKSNRILITHPDFSMYQFYSGIAELDTVSIVKDYNSYNLSTEVIPQIVKDNNIDFLIFSNPCNPTGVGIKREKIIELLKACNCVVCIDEAYMDFWNESVINLVNEFDNLLVLKTLSKNFGLAALRLGFVIAGEKLLTPIKKAKSPYNVNSLSQITGTVALNHKEYFKKATKELTERKRELYLQLKKLEKKDFIITDTRTNFITIKTTMANDIYNYLLSKNIVIRCLGKDLLRITTGSKQENDYLLMSLKGAF